MLLFLALAGALVYLTQIGLPDFAKKPLLDNLQARGLDLQFSRLRLSWIRGIVAENVRFGRAQEPDGAEFTADGVQLRLNHRALGRLQFQIDSLVLRNGRLVLPLTETNRAPRQLAVEGIQTDLRFLPGDEWAVDQFTAAFAGARIQLSGTVANASAVRDWKLLQAEQGTPAGAWRDRLREVADTLERVRFSVPPTLRLDVRGDARSLGGIAMRVLLNTTGADTPWGSISQTRFSARLYPATNGLSSAEVALEAGEARTRWAAAANVQITAHLSPFETFADLRNGELILCAGRVETDSGSATNVQLTLHSASIAGQKNLMNMDMALGAGHLQTQWGSATDVQVSAQWLHSLSNALPVSGDATLHCDRGSTEWGDGHGLRLGLHVAARPPGAPMRSDASWGAWASLEPYDTEWGVEAADMRSHGLEIKGLSCAGSWYEPKLTITNFHAELDRRRFDAFADLDVATRALGASITSEVDPHAVEPALPEEARHALEAVSWPQPPEIKGDIMLVLPAWTNREPDWRREVQPTLRVQGNLKLVHGGAYRGVEVSALQSHVIYSNLGWRLPDLIVLRPEGMLETAIEGDERTGDFHARVSSTLDPRFLRPLLDEKQQQGLDLITFMEPPVVGAEAWGNWHDLERIGVKGRVALTNFTFRGESGSGLQTSVQFTNQLLQFISPRIQRGADQMSADGVAVDLAAQLVFLTNGTGIAEPMVVARAIGTNVVRAIEAYHFLHPPMAHVYGTIPMQGEDAADVHFEVDGGPFEWWRFHVPHIAGHVHWLGHQVKLQNIEAEFYGGHLSGAMQANIHPGGEANYQFGLTTTNAQLGPLTKDLFATTNRLEGRLWGSLVITNASTTNLQTWNGYGDMKLREGLIWEIPVFGIFSDVLNGMVPGLGNSRASAGTCTFGIANGIIRSDDMDIRSTGMRLQYHGTLDFDGRINARVEAGLLRNTPVIGPIVSTVLWPVAKLFEYKVTGTLGSPKAEPVYLVPKVMLLPFQLPLHPLRTLRGLLPEDLGASPTNAPPLTAPKQN